MFPEIPDLSRYLFTIRGLRPGAYTVTIDGTVVATVQADELAGGWNATMLSRGPIFNQCRSVLAKIEAKVNQVDLYRRAWKTRLGKHDAHVDRGGKIEPAKAEATMTSALQAIRAADAAIDELVLPRTHAFEFARTGPKAPGPDGRR
jgi:hypothetical protein